MKANRHELVLYDIKRDQVIADSVEDEDILINELKSKAPYDYSLNILTNANTGSKEVERLLLYGYDLTIVMGNTGITDDGGEDADSNKQTNKKVSGYDS